MQSINRIGRALLVVSALSMPALALAEPPADGAPKAESPKKEKDAAHKHAKATKKEGDKAEKKTEKPAE